MGGELHSFYDVLQRWHTDALEFLRTDAPRIVVILLIAFLLVRLLHVLTHRLSAFSRSGEAPSGIRTQQLHTLTSVINGVGKFVILFLATMQVLQVVRINVGPLLASAGVAGLAIGFGAQTLVRDVINGFFVLMENQFDVGDVVKIANMSGTVERLTLRRTVLRDADGTVYTVPNGQITVVSNMTRDWTQSSMSVAVSYQEDSDRVITLLKEICTELHNDPQFANVLLADPQVPGIERVAPGEVDYLVLIKTKPGAQWDVLRELRHRIKSSLEKNNIQTVSPAPLYVLNQPEGRPYLGKV